SSDAYRTRRRAGGVGTEPADASIGQFRGGHRGEAAQIGSRNRECRYYLSDRRGGLWDLRLVVAKRPWSGSEFYGQKSYRDRQGPACCHLARQQVFALRDG